MTFSFLWWVGSQMSLLWCRSHIFPSCLGSISMFGSYPNSSYWLILFSVLCWTSSFTVFEHYNLSNLHFSHPNIPHDAELNTQWWIQWCWRGNCRTIWKCTQEQWKFQRNHINLTLYWISLWPGTKPDPQRDPSGGSCDKGLHTSKKRSFQPYQRAWVTTTEGVYIQDGWPVWNQKPRWPSWWGR